MTAGKEEQPVLAFPNLSMKWRLASAALVPVRHFLHPAGIRQILQQLAIP